VFFDRGAPGGEREIRRGRLEIRFIRTPMNADDAIHRYIEKIKPEATNFIVVSSDRQLQKAAKGSGVRWMKSEEFASLILQREDQTMNPGKPDQHLTPQEIDDWERLFYSKKEDK
jgi:predicted RNA-binding protein with PIN domain